MKALIKKYKSLILYGIFGVATTLVNIISYAIGSKLFGLSVITNTCIAWLVAVIFAYITNRIWVFESKTKKSKEIVREIFSFFSCRILTGILDIVIMYIFVDRLKFNDILIKTLSNVIVIIINYIASKFIIFNKESKLNNKYNYKELLIIFLIFCLAVLFSFNSPLNILQRGESLTDSSVFRFFGMMMSKGYTPYLDLFDHKGPIIYLINFLGVIINKNYGIWLIEIVFLFFSFYFIYKISKLKNNSFCSLAVVLLSIVNLFNYFEGGNLVEEYAILFIMVSLYIFIDYFLNNKINNIRIIICGACFACVCLLRINMIPCWIVFCIAVLIKCIMNKEFKQLFNYILNFVIGILIIVVPIFIWLISKGAFTSFIQDYFMFNISYSSTHTNVEKWNVFFNFTNNIVMIISIFVNIYAIINENKKTIYVSNLCFIILSLIMVSLSGINFNHYGMILIPTYVLPLTYFINLLYDKENKSIATIMLIYILSSVALPTWISLIQKIGPLYGNRCNNINNISSDVLQIKDLIEKNSNINDKITVFGNWDYIYYISNRESASKYSYQFPIGWVDSNIMKEYFNELNANNPKIIVIKKSEPNHDLTNLISNNDYKELGNINGNMVYGK